MKACPWSVWQMSEKKGRRAQHFLSKTTSKDTLNIISNIWQIFCSVIACDYGYKSRKAVLNSTLSMHTNFTYYLVQQHVVLDRAQVLYAASEQNNSWLRLVLLGLNVGFWVSKAHLCCCQNSFSKRCYVYLPGCYSLLL